MSAHHHNSHVIPQCRGRDCHEDADVVVAHRERDDEPYCFPCANAVLNGIGGLEYPLEEYYTPADHRVSQFDPDDQHAFDLFNPDRRHKEWISAQNHDDTISSVDPRDFC